MLMGVFIEGLKAMLMRPSWTESEEGRGPGALTLLCIGGVGFVSLLLTEVFGGLALYKILRFEYHFGEGISWLGPVMMYFFQTLLCAVLLQKHVRKKPEKNKLLKDYQVLKGLLHALIEGYKSK